MEVGRRYSDVTGETSMLFCAFERAGRSHGFILNVDHVECHEASDAFLVPGETLGGIDAMIRADAAESGLTLTVEDLDPAELRWQLERALDARAVHDEEDGGPEPGDDPDGPGYHLLAALLRARASVLPEPSRPPAEHGADARPAPPPAVPAAKLPAKRKRSDGPAPIYQIKISLYGVEPPIWRRVELPGDTGLADLHRIVQTVFDWEDYHLHVFETPYGSFGVADPELGYRAEKPVTLEQVAREPGAELGYLYDFGDSWEHSILVEKVLDRQAVPYPRCTGGERAAPPEDCGGVGGYQELVEVLADPAHPEHQDQLEWLGLPSAADFDPAHFDLAEVNRFLAADR